MVQKLINGVRVWRAEGKINLLGCKEWNLGNAGGGTAPSESCRLLSPIYIRSLISGEEEPSNIIRTLPQLLQRSISRTPLKRRLHPISRQHSPIHYDQSVSTFRAKYRTYLNQRMQVFPDARRKQEREARLRSNGRHHMFQRE